MKKSKTDTAKTRQKIIEIASDAIRKRGIDATGVAEIMTAAGMTHGGFYRHFSSKGELVAEAIAMSRKDFVAETVAAAEEGADALLKHFQSYLTREYRDDIGSGCPLAAVGSEIVRGDAKSRHVATGELRTLFDRATPFMRGKNGEGASDLAIGVVTNMIGALTMSRMVDDPALSERILAVTRNRLSEVIVSSAMRHVPKRDDQQNDA